MASLLRVPHRGILQGELDLDHEAARYATRVHRLREGARVLLFDPEAGMEAVAVVIATGRDVARVRVDGVRGATLLPTGRVALLQAVAKGEKMDAIVRDATELGATRIVSMRTSRAIAERAGARARWLRVAIEAARQCGRGDVPSIDDPVAMPQALRDTEESLKVVLVPTAAPSLGRRLRDARSTISVAVAVGPEGGFDEAELELLAGCAFLPASLGRFVLRTETAATAALAVIADHGAEEAHGDR